MPDLSFNQDNRNYFPTKYHGEISISKEKWREICQEPERFYYRENADKIATTLINPDMVQINNNYKNQVIYYKYFETILYQGKELNLVIKWWAVVVDFVTKKVCTVYPVHKPKKGTEYKNGGNLNEK